MNRIEIIDKFNDYSLDNSCNIQDIIECLNDLLENINYKNNLDLIFMGIASTQLYGFLSYLTEDEQNLFFESDFYRSNSYRGINIPFFNTGQLSFLYELDKYNKVFFSAPTSFGKTSIVAEYILNNTHTLNNILFILPTNSLLEELFEKFTLYNLNLNLNYDITTNPILQLNQRNILFLTPERFMILVEKIELSNFDLIVMDEAYKIVDSHSRSVSDFVNNRALRFRKVADLVGETDTKVIFLSPFTYSETESMKSFFVKHNIKKINRKLEYVNRNVINVSDKATFKSIFNGSNQNYQKRFNVLEKTKLILSNLYPQSSIIYVSNYSKAYEIASCLDSKYLLNENDSRYKSFLNHIEKNYLVENRDSWIVYDALKKGIGIYISPLPRYIKKEIVKLYERKVISVLIVTTAFTEGVNTCASNLIFTSLINGPTTNKLSDIDVLNVAGRAGRFSKNTIGKIFCITQDIYKDVAKLQKESNVKLENFNYKKDDNLLDFEIEMMDDEYLNDDQKEILDKQNDEIIRLGLTRKELNISLNVSNNWKLILYKHFISLNNNQIYDIYDNIKMLLNDEKNRIKALEFIFNDIKKAFKETEITVFPQENYEISPFDKKGNFTWGRLYKFYVSGSPKKIIKNNIKYIQSKFSEIVSDKKFLTKTDKLKALFDESLSNWILKYYKKDLSLNMNVFYSETFKIISNIIQYKIPFYLTFYVSMFQLFINKNNISNLKKENFEIVELIYIFEDGTVSGEFSRLIDYGIPLLIVDKLIDAKLTLEELKRQNYDLKEFDEYEKILIKETINLL